MRFMAPSFFIAFPIGFHFTMLHSYNEALSIFWMLTFSNDGFHDIFIIQPACSHEFCYVFLHCLIANSTCIYLSGLSVIQLLTDIKQLSQFRRIIEIRRCLRRNNSPTYRIFGHGLAHRFSHQYAHAFSHINIEVER